MLPAIRLPELSANRAGLVGGRDCCRPPGLGNADNQLSGDTIHTVKNLK